MKRKCLAIGISITAVVLLTLTSLTNVIGYQTVQSSNQNIINNEVNQKELLFQTIVDIANNQEIQRIILKSQMTSGKFLNLDATLSAPITKQQLRQMYFIGFILSKIISKSRIQSMVQQYQLINLEIQQKIKDVIENDVTLNTEITLLSSSECDCENDSGLISDSYPIICNILNNSLLALSNTLEFLGDNLYEWAVVHNKPLLAKICVLFYYLLSYFAIPLVFLALIFGCIEIPPP
jgi:hypothetical protein